MHILLFFEFRGIDFFFIIGFVFDINLHGILADNAESHFDLFENTFCIL